MAREPQSSGKCELCQTSFKKGGMSKHLESCLKKSQKSHAGSSTKKWFLKVDGGGPYWLYLQIRSNATLDDLDNYLRGIWLECCGHLSSFDINGEIYSDGLDDSDGDTGSYLEDIFEPKMQVEYEYDFGSTTTLIITAISEQKTPNQKKVTLLARNDEPIMPCCNCGKPSTEICSECVWEGEGLLCDDCAEEHECDEEMFLPVVNSPRTGICGYTG